MASGLTYRQKGDLRALNRIAEATYATPGTDSIYLGTLDTVTPKDSEEVTYVPAEGGRSYRQIYRTGADYAFSAKSTHTVGETQYASRTDGWEEWLKLASNMAVRTWMGGSNSSPQSFSAWFKTSSTEEHLYLGSVIDKLTISASE
jgi:glycosidase